MPSAVGPEGAGVRTIIEMVNLTRLDCAIASAGQMRIGAQPGAEPHPPSLGVPAPARRPARRCAPPWPTSRSSSRPRWRWCSVSAAPRSAPRRSGRSSLRAAADAGGEIPGRARARRRSSTRRSRCLGGNGYTEDLPLARYFRESPLNAIWEGSGNVMALDVLRAAGRHPEPGDGDRRALAHQRRPRQRSTCGRSPRRWPAVLRSATPNGARVSCAKVWPRSPRWPPGRSEVRFRHALRRHAAERCEVRASSAPPISAAPRRRLMDRALAA